MYIKSIEESRFWNIDKGKDSPPLYLGIFQ